MALDDALLEPGDDGVVHPRGLLTRQLHHARLPPHILAAPTVPAARTGLIRQGRCHVLIDLKVEAVVEDHDSAAVAAVALVVGGREDCVGVAAVVLDVARRLAAAFVVVVRALVRAHQQIHAGALQEATHNVRAEHDGVAAALALDDAAALVRVGPEHIHEHLVLQAARVLLRLLAGVHVAQHVDGDGGVAGDAAVHHDDAAADGGDDGPELEDGGEEPEDLAVVLALHLLREAAAVSAAPTDA